MGAVTISGPELLTLEGRPGQRYWVHSPFEFTGHDEVDERLSGYPVAVFLPPDRPAHETPLVIALQGMAAPCEWNSFILPPLLDRGIACVLFDTPFGGERSLTRNHQGDVFGEAMAFLERGVPVKTALVPRMMEAVARDLSTVVGLVRERHGLADHRRALFGISLGALLTAYGFTRDGIGTRLLGAIGHADLCRFARSYAPRYLPFISSLPARKMGKLVALLTGRKWLAAGLDYLGLLNQMRFRGEHTAGADPMHFADRVGPDRRVRFLVGDRDRAVKPGDAAACARRFPDGDCYVVPGLGHGCSYFGLSFQEHVQHFLVTQLADWGRQP